MAHRSSAPPYPTRTIRDWIVSPWIYIVLAAVLGLLAAQIVAGQIAARWVKALIGLIFVFALFKLPLYGVVALFLVAFPFPTYIFLGNTNIIFVLFMLIAWAIKVRLGKEPAPPKTYLDYAAWAYIGVHLISFLNVDTSSSLTNGILQVEFLAGAVGLYFLVSKLLRTERQLKIAFLALAFTSLLVSITGVMEYFLPAVKLIPDWFIAAGPAGKRFEEGGRVGGIFRAHSLLADFCAILFTLQVYLYLRSRNRIAKLFFLLLMAASVFQIFLTANRGGFLIWIFAILYLLWLGRGAITLRKVVIALPLLLAGGVLVEIVTARYGRIITLFWRLATTQLERGVPETRVHVWRRVLEEIPQHVWIGHGPFYDLAGGFGHFGRQWPHSAYLMYLWTTGVLGLAVFLWILGKTIAKSYPGGKLDLKKISFAHGAMVVAHVQVIQFAMAQIRDEHQRGNVYPYLMWALFALAVAARRIKEEQERSAAALPGERDGEGPARARDREGEGMALPSRGP
ncbi:MAG: hypothetical protein FJY88_01425 [Candidatus Eisenbacteria bacterium]|nr:hypothetical protein [Candidatus Eisenbacteria bacterium]